MRSLRHIRKVRYDLAKKLAIFGKYNIAVGFLKYFHLPLRKTKCANIAYFSYAATNCNAHEIGTAGMVSPDKKHAATHTHTQISYGY